MRRHLKVIIDFDGTLTAEEAQVAALASRSLDTLADEILGAPRGALVADYQAVQARLLLEPHRHWWEVNGLVASYCDEVAFILNTTTLQTMLRENPAYARAVAVAFPRAEYDPVVDCTNYLFHRHTAELPPRFRPAARDVLTALNEHPERTPLILTNSLGDKVRRHLDTLELDEDVAVLTTRASTKWFPIGPIASCTRNWVRSRSGPWTGNMRWIYAARPARSLSKPRIVISSRLLRSVNTSFGNSPERYRWSSRSSCDRLSVIRSATTASRSRSGTSYFSRSWCTSRNPGVSASSSVGS